MTLRRACSVAALGAVLALGSVAFAAPPVSDDVERNVAEAKDEAEGRHARGEGEGAEGETGITNWWSWDYGASPKDPAHRGWPPPFGWALVNFGVFLWLLSRILWKPLKTGWISRHEAIKSELAEARRLHREAEARLAEYTSKVGNVALEVDALLAQLRKEAEADRQKLIAAAEAEAQRLKDEADRQIKAEIERARAELRKQAVDAAVAAAREILQRGVTPDDQQRLADQYLGELDRMGPRAGRGGVA